jgi:predicted outer membrane repeat protein
MVGRFLSGHPSMRILRFPLPRRDLLKTLPLAALCCAPASMAATLTVLNADSEGPGSLYQTVADAAPGDTIVFAPSLSGATIRPTLMLDYIRIERDLVIDGSALSPKITITGDRDGDSTPDTGVVRVAAGITVTLKNLILTRSQGAAILSQGNLTIIDCEVRDSAAGFSSRGGGILAFGPTTITGSVIANNTAGLDGGGIAINAGAFTISNSTITGNSAGNAGGGVFVALTNTGVTISNSQISGNTAVLRGGGIYNDAPAVTLTETRVTGNTSTTDHGGGLDGSFDISDSVISNNTAALNGGAIYVDSNRTLTVQRSTLAGNQAGPNSYGGALLVRGSGTATLVNSTLSGNSGGFGGAIYNQANGTVNLASVTLAGNQSPNAGGIGGLANVGVVNFVNTLIAGSTNGDCAPAPTTWTSAASPAPSTATACPAPCATPAPTNSSRSLTPFTRTASSKLTTEGPGPRGIKVPLPARGERVPPKAAGEGRHLTERAPSAAALQERASVSTVDLALLPRKLIRSHLQRTGLCPSPPRPRFRSRVRIP